MLLRPHLRSKASWQTSDEDLVQLLAHIQTVGGRRIRPLDLQVSDDSACAEEELLRVAHPEGVVADPATGVTFDGFGYAYADFQLLKASVASFSPARYWTSRLTAYVDPEPLLG